MTLTGRAQLHYWLSQFELISPGETLDEINRHLTSRRPGAYLRFGENDIQLLAGRDSALQRASPALCGEIQEAFSLEGPGIYKALSLDCPALGLQPGMKPGLFGVSDRKALYHLRHAGRYFTGGKVYHHSALAYLSIFNPKAAIEFLADLRAYRPLFVGKETIQPDLIQTLFGHTGHVAGPGRDAFAHIDRIEEIAHQFLHWDRAYPVVVIALGCTGRVLAKRLLKGGFKGFIFDFGSLIDALSVTNRRNAMKHAPHPPTQILDTEWPAKPVIQPYVPKARRASHANAGFLIRWEGPQLLHHSFAVINRELCIQLARDSRIDLSIIPVWPHQFTPAADPRFSLIHERLFQPLSGPADVTVRHLPWPEFKPPRQGHWVVIKPWEYPVLPPEWLPYLHDEVDEIWVHSRFVFDCYVRSGIPPELVQYIPLGVNTATYHPAAEPAQLETDKTFKFLFVGGTLWRKGTDILIRAYHKAFTERDDVCLVIKDFGKKTFYADDTYQKLNARLQRRARAPEVLYADSFLSDQDLARLYTACDCLVHPYRAEGFGLPIAEAMASGLPAIVPDRGPALDYLSDQTGYRIPARIAYIKRRTGGRPDRSIRLEYAEPDEQALIETMRHVVNHPEEAKAKGRVSSEAIRLNWTWERSAQAVVKRFEALKKMPIRRSVRN